jgi:hypothetical protein
MAGAVYAAPDFGLAERCLVRLVDDDRVELYVDTPGPRWGDPWERPRAVAGGAALRNLELVVVDLGYRPLVQLLPDPQDPRHLATVRAGENVAPDNDASRLHRAMQGDVDAEPGGREEVCSRLRSARLPPGVQAVPMSAAQVRSIGTVLAASHRLDRRLDHRLAPGFGPGRERRIAAVRESRREHAIDGGVALAERLSHGQLLLLTTASDRPADWLRAGWAAQHLSLTTASGGLVASAVGGALDAPGVRAALAARLGAADCPQLLLRVDSPPELTA